MSGYRIIAAGHLDTLQRRADWLANRLATRPDADYDKKEREAILWVIEQVQWIVQVVTILEDPALTHAQKSAALAAINRP